MPDWIWTNKPSNICLTLSEWAWNHGICCRYDSKLFVSLCSMQTFGLSCFCRVVNHWNSFSLFFGVGFKKDWSFCTRRQTLSVIIKWSLFRVCLNLSFQKVVWVLRSQTGNLFGKWIIWGISSSSTSHCNFDAKINIW